MTELQWTNETFSILMSIVHKISSKSARSMVDEIVIDLQNTIGDDVSKWPTPRQAIIDLTSKWD